ADVLLLSDPHAHATTPSFRQTSGSNFFILDQSHPRGTMQSGNTGPGPSTGPVLSLLRPCPRFPSALPFPAGGTSRNLSSVYKPPAARRRHTTLYFVSHFFVAFYSSAGSGNGIH